MPSAEPTIQPRPRALGSESQQKLLSMLHRLIGGPNVVQESEVVSGRFLPDTFFLIQKMIDLV